MVFSEYVKLRILYHANMGGIQGVHYTKAVRRRRDQSVHVWSVQVSESLRSDRHTGRPTKVTVRVKELVAEQMTRDDETTATQLHRMLLDNGVDISLSTILRCRTSLGWTFRGSAYIVN